jgi:hypothetical protein
MNIEIKGDDIISVKMGQFILPLTNVNESDLPELKKHVKYFEEHLGTVKENPVLLDKQDVTSILSKAPHNQLVLLKILLKHPNIIQTTLMSKLGFSDWQSIAGIIASFRKKINKYGRNKLNLIQSKKDSSKDCEMVYSIGKGYTNILNEYFST